MRKIFVVSAATAGLLSCFPVKFNVDTSSSGSMTVKLGDLSGTCEGSKTVQGEDSTATVTRTTEGQNCRVEVTFEATVVDMGEVRAQVEEEIKDKDHDPKDVDVDITSLSFDFSNINLVGLPGIPSTGWELDLTLEDKLMFDGSGPDLPSLLAFATNVPLSAEQVAIANEAYNSRSPVTVSGNTILTSIPMSYVQSLQAGTEASITFGVKVTTKVKASTEAF